jgi:hypothetical protein
MPLVALLAPQEDVAGLRSPLVIVLMLDYKNRVASKCGRHLGRLRLATSPANPAAIVGRFDHGMAGGGDYQCLA